MDEERQTEDGAPDGSTGSPKRADGRGEADAPSDAGDGGSTDRPTGIGTEEPSASTSPAGGESDATVGSSSPADEEAALERVRTVSRLLDDAVAVPGTDVRVGLDPVLGVLPVAGDAAAMLLSLYPVLEAYRLGMSRGTLAKMLVLVAVDAVIGSVPVLGPVFDAFWKANRWNLRTLERHLEVD